MQRFAQDSDSNERSSADSLFQSECITIAFHFELQIYQTLMYGWIDGKKSPLVPKLLM